MLAMCHCDSVVDGCGQFVVVRGWCWWSADPLEQGGPAAAVLVRWDIGQEAGTARQHTQQES